MTLGLIASEGPVTGYQVMRQFQSSSSSYFSGSAGAIYPLLKRLDKMGLIEDSGEKLNSKTKARYRITPLGQEKLCDWVRAPIPVEDVSYAVDFLRSRVFFMKSLTPEEIGEFVKDARGKLKVQVRLHKAKASESNAAGDAVVAMGYQSLVMVDEARLKWLDMVEKRLVKGQS